MGIILLFYKGEANALFYCLIHFNQSKQVNDKGLEQFAGTTKPSQDIEVIFPLMVV